LRWLGHSFLATLFILSAVHRDIASAAPLSGSGPARMTALADSLMTAGRISEADSLLRAQVALRPLVNLRDSLAASQVLVRLFELTEEASPPFRPDSSRARAGVAFAIAAANDARQPKELVLRAQLAGARCALLVGDAPGARLLLEHAHIGLTGGARPDPRAEATLWLLTARAFSASSSRDSALVAADSAVAVAERARLHEIDLATIKGWQGVMWAKAGKYPQAAAQLGEAVAQLDRKLQPWSPTIAQLRYVRAAAFSNFGEVRSAIAEYEALVSALEQCGEVHSFTYAVILEQLGARQRRFGNLVAAKANGERAVEVMRATVGESHGDFGFANTALGPTLRDLGDLAGSVRVTRCGYDVMATRLGPHYVRLGEVCNNMAILFRRMNQPDSALSWLHRAQEIYLAQPDTSNVEYYNALGTLAHVLGDLGRASEAAPIAASAAQRMEKAIGPDHHYVAALLLVQAMTARALGDLQSSGALLDTVVARRIRRFGHVHPDVEDALLERAYLRALQGDRSLAFSDALEAAGVGRLQRQAVLRGLDERSALALLSATTWTGVDLALTLLESGPESDSLLRRVYSEATRQRSMLLEELLARQRDGAALAGADSSRAWRSRLRAEAAGLILSGDRRAASMLDSLSRVEAGLPLARGIGRANDGGAPASGSESVPELIAARPPGASLVSFVRYQHVVTGAGADGWKAKISPAYAVFVVPAGSNQILFRPLGPAAPIDSQLSAWLAACAGTGAASNRTHERSIGRTLRRRILDPVLAATRGSSDLYMVLDGDLEFLDPAALPDDASGYLLEHRPRFERLLREGELLARSDTSEGSGLVALGGADFDSRSPESLRTTSSPSRFSSCEAVELRRFASLPASGAEVQAVARRWRASHVGGCEPVTLLMGRDATERAVRDSVAGRRVVHLATHGFVLDDSCEAWAPNAARVFRTLFRSGLVLAGANLRSGASDPEDDGLLTAGEISTLDLRGSQWVCLSGCETGLGESVRGEGTYGLVRAFRLAGARQVLMSLWPVPDESAALWNDAFYAELAGAGVGLDEAARRASLSRLRALRRAGLPTPPANWACFTVAGPDR
jgi:CHAT domain-containing protein/tetratricopeptide (TPR) repeat protein